MSDLNATTVDAGTILTTASGNAIYQFAKDEKGAGKSACEGDCIAMWPAVGEISSMGDGIDADLVGTLTRPDGMIQATYNGWPLYTFVKDAVAGDTNGQGMKDIWWLLDAGGNPVSG